MSSITKNVGVEGAALAGAELHLLQPLAALISTDEDLAIFRRFDQFNILRLLVLQGEVEILTKELKAIFPKFCESRTPTSAGYSASYIPEEQSESPSNQTDGQLQANLKEKWEQLQRKLREYNRALIEVSQVKNLDLADVHDINRLRNALRQQSTRTNVPLKDANIYWDEGNVDDFVTLRTEAMKGSRVNIWLEVMMALFWRVKDIKRGQTIIDRNGDIAVGHKGPHMSRAKRAQKLASTSRFSMAFFGGLALIVPTIIMAKFEGINISLITTSVSVVIFGLLLAYGATDSTGKDVLASTAAYTAVLVVFVGTSLSGGTDNTLASASSNSTGGA